MTRKILSRWVTRLVAALSVLLSTTACDMVDRELRMYVSDYRQFSAESLRAIFNEQSRLTIIDAGNFPDHSPLEILSDDEADLALVENSAAFVPGIRAVLPVYESVLHLAMRNDFEPEDFRNPLRKASFHVANRSAAGDNFVALVTRRQGLAETNYEVTNAFIPGNTDIIVYFGPIDPENTSWLPEGYSLVSLANRLNPQRKFFEEGIGYSAPNMKPKVIPALTYDLPGNEEGLLTVAVDTLLVTRKDVPVSTIYELTRTFLVQKPRFNAIAPHLFSGINESFDPLNLSFPLHDGARRYLERDDPGLLERYAETINMLMYLVFLIITGFLGLGRWRAQRKKDRIDVFYERVIAIRGRIGTEESTQLLGELDDLEREAFESLVKEKLAANESFRIFTDLMARLRTDLSESPDN